MTNQDIEPCPYCDYKWPTLAIETQDIQFYKAVYYAYVLCGECWARGRIYHELERTGPIEELAIMAWNHMSRLLNEA